MQIVVSEIEGHEIEERTKIKHACAFQRRLFKFHVAAAIPIGLFVVVAHIDHEDPKARGDQRGDKEELDRQLGKAKAAHEEAGAALFGEGEGEAAEAGAEPQKAAPVTRDTPKVGRNEPCPCGSGKKYKQCHGKLS